VGGRRGECIATVALDFKASEPGKPGGRFEKEADKGEGRLGEEANTPCPGDLPKPDEIPAEGGPNGSLIGEEGCRPPDGGGDWIDDESADRIATGEANSVSGEVPSGRLGLDLPSGVLTPPSRVSRC
jgi:hypothetical protein